jgi:hypothetical protein
MTPSDFDRHFDLAVADAEQALVDGGNLAPMYLFVDRNGHGQLVGAPSVTIPRGLRHPTQTAVARSL